jgi:hypothetical protein
MFCKDMDGKEIQIKNAKLGENIPPFHPNDRCIIVAAYGAETENNETSEKSTEEFSGKAFPGFKGKQAIEKLMNEKRGYVPDAFENKDIGSISLIWGDATKGLAHIIKRREEENINVKEFLSDLSDVIETGALRFNGTSKRFEIFKNGKLVVVDFVKEGMDIKFLLTAFKRRK